MPRGLTVAVTGPTGDIGRSPLRALERSREVSRTRAMARSPFDPIAAGQRMTEYRQPDVLDADAVAEVVTGADNLAASGTIAMSDLAAALGWDSVPAPDLAVGDAAELVARLPFVPAEAQWIETVVRHSVLIDTRRARKIPGWRPEHDAAETLAAMVDAGRLARPIR